VADERLRIRIEADAERAEQELKTLADLSEELTDDELSIVVAMKTEAAEANLKSLLKQMQQAEDPVDLKVLTVGVKQAQDQLEQLRKTADDLPPVDLDTRKATQGLDDVTRSADGSRSVLANMIGNTTQDLGALGGVAGSAGVAIGQMGEYMADAKFSGEGMGSVVKNFAGIAGPMIALSAGVLAATKAWEAYNSRTKETRRLTAKLSGDLADVTGSLDDVEASLGDNTDAWSLMNRALAENTDEFPKVARALGALGVPVEDLSRTLNDMEVDSRATWQALAEGAGVPRDIAAGFAEAGAEGESFKEIFNLLAGTGLQGAAEKYRPIIEAIEEVDDASQKFLLETTAHNELLNRSAADATAGLVEMARAAVGPDGTELEAWERFVELQTAVDVGAGLVKTGIGGAATNVRDYATAAVEARTANEDLRESLFGSADAGVEAGRTWSDLNDDVTAFRGITDPTRADVESLNDSVFNYADAQVAAAGTTRATAEGARIYKTALSVAAGVLGDEMNPELQAYIDKANAVPDTAVTTVTADTAAAKADLDALTAARTVYIDVAARGLTNFTSAVTGAINSALGAGRSTQSQAARYVWRNGRYVEVGG
jgi:hypothetical protein